MHRSRRFPTFLAFAALFLGVAMLGAQSADDLPAAPSEAIKPKPAPKKADPPTPASADPAQTSNESAQQDGRATASSTDPNPSDDQPALNSDTTFKTLVNEVSVVFTVTDKHNRYVKDLSQEDFKVVDDNRPVGQFRFRREKDLPLQVGLLIDASNSIRDRFKFEQESAIEFLSEIIRPRYDKAFVLGFDVEPEVTQDFTDNTEKLAIGVRMLKAGGGTAMFDALYYACRDKLLKSPQTSSVRRAVILVSDGEDNQSHVTREEAIEMALRANVIVYTISTNFPNGGGPGDRILQRIADATGGRAFQPFQLQQVADAFQQIQADLRSQYELSYRPENFAHDGRYRTIEISALRKGLKVRSRNGYYAPTE
jgi:Ca-activated chloride channel homolog